MCPMKTGETSPEVPKLAQAQDDMSLTCPFCGRGTLQLVGERPHPLYGTLGVTETVLRCHAADCHKVTVM
jgi:hypothetical protein